MCFVYNNAELDSLFVDQPLYFFSFSFPPIKFVSPVLFLRQSLCPHPFGCKDIFKLEIVARTLNLISSSIGAKYPISVDFR